MTIPPPVDARITVRSLGWTVDGHEILRGVDLHVADGELVGLLGPNGSGKTSLLRCAYRHLRPTTGSVQVDGHDVWSLSARDTARRVAVVVQEPGMEFDFTVEEVVRMGRIPHMRLFDRASADDDAAVADALARTEVAHLSARRVTSLSGGERQRVLLARALAQSTSIVVLDEPTNHLDVRYQLEMLQLVRSTGRTALAALHDLNLAAGMCDRVYLLADGEVVAAGVPSAVITADSIAAVFGIRPEVFRHPRTGRTVVDLVAHFDAIHEPSTRR